MPAIGGIERALRVLGTVAERGAAPGHLVARLLGAVARIVPADLVTLSVCDLEASRRLVTCSPARALSADDLARFDRLLAAHPLVRYHAAQPRARARRLSDCIADDAFRASELFDVYYRPLGLDRVLLAPLERAPRRLTGIVLNRAGRDFADDEVRLLQLLHAPLVAVYRQSIAAACADCAASLLHRVAANDRVGVLALDRRLDVVDASGSALAWLGETVRGAPSAGTLPSALRTWLRARLDEAAAMPGEGPSQSLVAESGGTRLAFHCLPGAVGGCTVLIEREPPERARPGGPPRPLTAREVEVLGWLAAGKTDACIAELLGLSPRTINKHLQNIYRKLGVANRTGALMRALGR